jgi:hypothetical protein
MRAILIAVFILSMGHHTAAQKKAMEWQVGYFAPYVSNIGGTVGYAYEFKKWEASSSKGSKSENRIQLLTQLSYFSQLNVSSNVLLNPEIVYSWNHADKRFFLSSSIGTGYLISFQKQGGALNLATGATEYRHDTLNYFLPNINLGSGFALTKSIGFFFKATYGRKLSTENANSAFLGLTAGLILTFKSSP